MLKQEVARDTMSLANLGKVMNQMESHHNVEASAGLRRDVLDDLPHKVTANPVDTQRLVVMSWLMSMVLRPFHDM
jgi:hypothetical protein